MVQNYYFSVEVMTSIAWDTDTNNKGGAKAEVAVYVQRCPKHKSARAHCLEQRLLRASVL